MYYQQRPIDFWEGLLGGLAQGIERNREKRQNKELWNAYLSMKNAESQENIQPYQDYANAAKENVFRANLVQNANRTAQANMAGLTNPDYLRSLGVTEDELAGYTPQISNTQQKFIAEQQAAAPKINEYAQAAGQVNTDAGNLLEQAKQRYSPAVFETLSPYIGKIPTETLINMAESLDKKRIEREEKAREKQEKIQAAEIIKQAAQSGLSDQQRIALYASNPYTMKIAEQIAGRNPQQPMHVASGSWVQQPDGSWKQVGQQSGSQIKLANGNIGMIYPDGTIKDTGQKFYVSEGKTGSKDDNEKYYTKYEREDLPGDLALLNEYNGRVKAIQEAQANINPNDPASMLIQTDKITPEQQTKYNQASARLNQYYAYKNPGYRTGQQEAQPQQAEPQQQAASKESRVINGNQYNALYKELTTKYGMSDADARQYIADNYTSQ